MVGLLSSEPNFVLQYSCQQEQVWLDKLVYVSNSPLIDRQDKDMKKKDSEWLIAAIRADCLKWFVVT